MKRVSKAIAKRFDYLLGHSEAKVHIYCDSSGNMEFAIQQPDGPMPPDVRPDHPTYRRAGILDRATGEVTETPRQGQHVDATPPQTDGKKQKFQRSFAVDLFMVSLKIVALLLFGSVMVIIMICSGGQGGIGGGGGHGGHRGGGFGR